MLIMMITLTRSDQQHCLKESSQLVTKLLSVHHRSRCLSQRLDLLMSMLRFSIPVVRSYSVIRARPSVCAVAPARGPLRHFVTRCSSPAAISSFSTSISSSAGVRGAVAAALGASIATYLLSNHRAAAEASPSSSTGADELDMVHSHFAPVKEYYTGLCMCCHLHFISLIFT